MGLDSVELLMAYEDAFGIEVSDAEAAPLRTPADVIALIAAKIGTGRNSVCLTRAGFHRVRRAICSEFGTPRREVRPSTLLTTLFAKNRRKHWHAIHTRTGLKSWPALDVPTWLWICSILIGPILCGYWLFSSGTLVSVGMLFALPISIFAGIVGMLILAKPLQTVLPFNTVGELAEELAIYNSAALAGDNVLSREQIGSIVREITITQLGLKSEQYREDADFIRDLGMD